MIEVRCCHDLAQAEPWRDAINALNLASARPDPFSTFEYLQHHLLHAAAYPQGPGLRLWLLLAFDGDELVGYLALKQCTHRVLGLLASKLDLLTDFIADRPHLVSCPDRGKAVSAAMYAYLLARRSEWSLLEFQQQEGASLLSPAPDSWECQSEHWPNPANGTVTMRWTSTAGYVADLSRKSRSNVGRRMRSLLAAGEVQVLSSSDPQSLPALFELYCSIEPHSWKAQAELDIGRDRRSLAYVSGLMDPAQPMRIAIQVLLLDGVPIAGLISGAFLKGLYALQAVYDDRLARLAPGSAMLLMGMRLAIDGHYEFFNLLSGFGYYKSRWLAQMSETRSVQIYRVGTPFFWHRALGDLRRCFQPSGGAEVALFNPSRRDIDKPEPADAGDARGALANPLQRERYAALVASVRRGRSEFLSSPQLAASIALQPLH